MNRTDNTSVFLYILLSQVIAFFLAGFTCQLVDTYDYGNWLFMGIGNLELLSLFLIAKVIINKEALSLYKRLDSIGVAAAILIILGIVL